MMSMTNKMTGCTVYIHVYKMSSVLCSEYSSNSEET